MKVLVNDTTALQVVNEKTGEVLYEWNPFKDKITYATKGKSVINCISESFVSGDIKWTLNDEEVSQIINTPKAELEEIEVFNDINLTKSERVHYAAKIIESRKNKK